MEYHLVSHLHDHLLLHLDRPALLTASLTVASKM